jgi:hypothetical protein
VTIAVIFSMARGARQDRAQHPRPDEITMDVTLSVGLLDGRRVSGGGFGIGGIRHGTNAIWKAYRGPQLSDAPEEHQRLLEKTFRFGMPDIEDSINQMLGRDGRVSGGNVEAVIRQARLAARLVTRLRPDALVRVP